MLVNYKKIICIVMLSVLLQSCVTAPSKDGKPKSVHGTEPLINIPQVVSDGKKEMQKKIDAGPKPYDMQEKIRESKRQTITTENVKNYVSIPSEYTNLKQLIDINFQELDFKYAMSLMADIGDINILVGDEVAGTVNAKIRNVPWDTALQALLDMKSLSADIDAAKGIIRVGTPEKLTLQETAKSARTEVVKKRIALEESVEPQVAEIFKLYYITPDQAKKTLQDLYSTSTATGTGATTTYSTLSNINITVEDTTRSIIVRGSATDIDTIDAVIKAIDVKTKQVLIEAFIIEADSTFQQALGSRIGAMSKSGSRPSGNPSGDTSVISGTIGGAATTPAGITLGAAAGTIANNSITGATSGIGILKTLGTYALKLELEALQSLGKNRIVSSPSVFTLNNKEAKITQGNQIPYKTTVDGTTTTAFKEAALSLTVTPSIIGDGNVLLDIKVNNDSPQTIEGADEPGIKTNEITTKLLVADGDIVVIGGIKIDNSTDTRSATPGVSKVPVFGNLFKSKNETDKISEMLIFISPRVIE